MRILIVDDNPLDREMICETLKEIDESFSISEADCVDVMFKRLKKPCDLLLLDISLDSSDPCNSAGLEALRELIGEFPDVPVAIVTGHYKEKVDEFLSYLGSSKQLIGYIDKLRLSEESLGIVTKKAVSYKSEFRESKSNIDRAHYYANAFTGDDWRQRIAAESWIPDMNGACNINGMLLWIAIEDTIRKRAQVSVAEKVNISGLITTMKKSRIIEYDMADMLFQCKFARDSFVHHKQDIRKNDALLMCKCLDALG